MCYGVKIKVKEKQCVRMSMFFDNKACECVVLIITYSEVGRRIILIAHQGSINHGRPFLNKEPLKAEGVESI